jgi:hypothetical protein
MQAFKINFFLFIAVFMFAAKPFVGFSMQQHFMGKNHPTILVKSFTKRKQEHPDESEFNISTVLKRLANPVIPLCLLFAFALNGLIPALLSIGKKITSGIVSNIQLSLLPQGHLYLLGGKLSI